MRTLVLPLAVLISSDNPVRPPDVATAARNHAAESRDQAVKDNQPMNQTLKLTRWARCRKCGAVEVIAENDPGQSKCPICGQNLTEIGPGGTPR